MANSDWSTLPLILSAFNHFIQISPSFDLHPNISDRFPSQFIFVGDKINTSQSTGRVELCQIFHPNNWCTDICKTPIPTFKPLAILTFSALVLRPSVDFLLLPSSDYKILPPITKPSLRLQITGRFDLGPPFPILHTAQTAMNPNQCNDE